MQYLMCADLNVHTPKISSTYVSYSVQVPIRNCGAVPL